MKKTNHLILTRSQILSYRRRATALDERLPRGPLALRQAAWAGLQDSMPRAAWLSIHARMANTDPGDWEDSSLVQVWGPRFSVYVVAKRDLAIFTLGRLPDKGKPLKRAQDIAARLQLALDGNRMTMRAAADAIGVQDSNRLRYAAPTGTVLIFWDGAHQPELWNVPAPDMDPYEARLELARRYLHVFGPTTPKAFAQWAGIGTTAGIAAFKALDKSLTQVHTPIGEAWILSQDESLFHTEASIEAPARLIPSGHTWFLLQGSDRELLVPDGNQRRALWPPRVWPGALLIDGETAGIWRRAGHELRIETWHPLSPVQRKAVEAEAESMRLPGMNRPMEVGWDHH